MVLRLCEAGYVALREERNWEVREQSSENALPLRQMKEQKEKRNYAVCIRRSPFRWLVIG